MKQKQYPCLNGTRNGSIEDAVAREAQILALREARGRRHPLIVPFDDHLPLGGRVPGANEVERPVQVAPVFIPGALLKCRVHGTRQGPHNRTDLHPTAETLAPLERHEERIGDFARGGVRPRLGETVLLFLSVARFNIDIHVLVDDGALRCAVHFEIGLPPMKLLPILAAHIDDLDFHI